MADVVKLVPRKAGLDESDNGTGDVSTWLRMLADKIEKGDYGTVAAAVIVMREDTDEKTAQFCLRTRRCNMNYVEQAGTLNMMHHDMLHAGS